MNKATRALWYKAMLEARAITVCSMALMFAFSLLFVWLTGLIELGALRALLKALPIELERLSAIPFTDVTTPGGLVSVLYVDPVILITCGIWAVSRGSAAISGEIDRGTMELLLSRPVQRIRILWTQAIVGSVGAMMLALSVHLAIVLGIYLFPPEEGVTSIQYLPCTINLFFFTFCALGFATMCSSFDRYRGRTIGLAGGVMIIQLVIKVIARMWPDGGWLYYFTILTVYEPQIMLERPNENDGTLAAIQRRAIRHRSPLLHRCRCRLLPQGPSGAALSESSG